MKIFISMAMALFSCSLAMAQTPTADNPFFKQSPLQYHAPEFDKIKNEHFQPAFDEGMKQRADAVKKIAENKAAPTFANTVMALEKTGDLLNRATAVFYGFASANTNPVIQRLQAEYASKFAAHNDGIYLNDQLFQRIKTLYNQRNNLKLDAEDKRLIEYYFQRFELAGANIAKENKDQLKALNAREATLQANFTAKLLAARRAGAVVVDNAGDLDGLSQEEIEAAANDAKQAGHEGKYLLPLSNTTQQPLLTKLKNRALREKLYRASWTRAEKGDSNDTRPILEEMARIRLQKAKLLGYPNFASWKLLDQMAKKPENALGLLQQLATPAVARAKKEAAEIQQMIDAQQGGFKLEPWDWNFYAEQVRKAKYDLDESQIKPYFEVTRVLEKGVFFAAGELYGITFKERKDLPVYHPDVVAYEVFDKDGKSMAIYYLDFYTRDNKAGGAWMSSFNRQSYINNQKPVIYNVFNYQKPAPGRPSLISWDDVITLFHEFGHSIHGLFASQKYPSISGTSTPRDFVEFPSQINEHWASDPRVLNNYAVHHQTGKVIPADLVAKIKKSSTFNEGYNVTELVAAAMLDMKWHSVTNENDFKPALEFERDALQSSGLLVNEVPPRYHSPYFQHIWANNYSAGYYAYLWSEMLGFDAIDWFEKNGGLTRANGDKFRKHILSVGNTKDLNQQFILLTGRKAAIQPMLKARGLVGEE